MQGSTHGLVNLAVDVGFTCDLFQKLIDSMGLLWDLLPHVLLLLDQISDKVAGVLSLQVVHTALDSLKSTLSRSAARLKLPLPRLLLLDALVKLAKPVRGD